MDVVEAGTPTAAGARRCHLWCWAPSAEPPEWEQRTFVVGGLSILGLTAAGISAALSASGNRRRRDAAIREATPKWRYVTSGVGQVVGNRLVVTEESGAIRFFDPVETTSVDRPAPGWLRMQETATSAPWAIQVM